MNCGLARVSTEISSSDMEGGGGEIRESITGKEKRATGGWRSWRRILYRYVVRSAFFTSDEQKVSRFD